MTINETRLKNQAVAEWLTRLYRVVFGDAAKRWFAAIGIELAIGLVTVVIAFAHLGDGAAIAWAFCAAIAYAAAYVLRLGAEQLYDLGETVRRQSVLSDALDWSVSAIQISEWEREAGPKRRVEAEKRPRDSDFYETKRPAGPIRLAEMTAESAFWTRYQYRLLSKYLYIAMALVIALVIAGLVVPLVGNGFDNSFKTVVIILFPVIISLDVLGWVRRLQSMAGEIMDIEKQIEELIKNEHASAEQAMRLAGEYNCVVAQGIPILDWWFFRIHDEIQAAWDTHSSRPGM
jgi:hypothetical protein